MTCQLTGLAKERSYVAQAKEGVLQAVPQNPSYRMWLWQPRSRRSARPVERFQSSQQASVKVIPGPREDVCSSVRSTSGPSRNARAVPGFL